MKILLTARGIELDDDLKGYVVRRIQFALGRYAAKIKSLSIRLEDVNGPKGGIDKGCQIRVDAGFAQKVIILERSETVHAAAANAIERVERSVERHLSLARTAGRRPARLRADFGFGG